jgi:hypothetical protein
MAQVKNQDPILPLALLFGLANGNVAYLPRSGWWTLVAPVIDCPEAKPIAIAG